MIAHEQDAAHGVTAKIVIGDDVVPTSVGLDAKAPVAKHDIISDGVESITPFATETQTTDARLVVVQRVAINHDVEVVPAEVKPVGIVVVGHIVAPDTAKGQLPRWMQTVSGIPIRDIVFDQMFCTTVDQDAIAKNSPHLITAVIDRAESYRGTDLTVQDDSVPSRFENKCSLDQIVVPTLKHDACGKSVHHNHISDRGVGGFHVDQSTTCDLPLTSGQVVIAIQEEPFDRDVRPDRSNQWEIVDNGCQIGCTVAPGQGIFDLDPVWSQIGHDHPRGLGAVGEEP